MRVTATAAVAPNSGASTAAAPAARVRLRVRDHLGSGLIALAVVLAGPVAHPAQPPGDAAAELAASGRLDAALTLLDGWLADHPGDERLFPVVLQVATAAPDKRTVDAVLGRYGGALAAENVGVLRAVPADWAELRGGVEQALDELRSSRLPDAGRRQAVLLLELGQFGIETMPREAPIAVHAGLARGGEGIDDPALEDSLRRAFAAAGPADGGAAGAVAGYGLVTLLSAIGRSAEAASVLAELGRRYPRSPEYALAAAELRVGHLAGGGAPPPVVALPSAAMLLGSATLVCPSPCAIPVAALLQPAAPAAPAAPPRQAAPAGEATRSSPAAAPAADRRPDRVVLVPATVPAPVPATAPAPVPATAPAPVPATAPATAAAPRQRADSAPVASSAVRAATTDDSRRRAAAPAAAVRSASSARPTVKKATRAGSTAAAPAAPVAAPAAAVASAAADRALALAAAQAGPASAATSRPARATTPRLDSGSGVTTRAQAAPGHSAAAARAPAPDAGTLIRVSAQPATRARLSTDRVFVAAESRAGSGARSPAVRASAVAAGGVATAGTASPAPASARSSGVRVASAPDPAAFAVQVGAYIDADNALEMELKLRQAGFPAIARSYRNADGSIVHRVGVGGNVTRAKGEQVLTRLSDSGFDAYVSRRDVVSYLPPAPRRR